MYRCHTTQRCSTPCCQTSSTSPRRSTDCWPAETRLPGQAHELVLERHAAFHGHWSGPRAGDPCCAKGAMADDLERVEGVGDAFRRKEGRPVGKLKVDVRLGGVSGVPQERDHLSTLDMV